MPRALPAGAQCWSPFSPDLRALPSSSGRAFIAEHSEQDIVRLPPDKERSIVHQALTDHFRKTLDDPIPALKHKTPRKAVQTAKGRKKVIAWLKMLENQSAQQRPEDPMGVYDFTWLWRELGVGDERR